MATRGVSPTSTASTQSNITVQTEKQGEVRAMMSASPSFSTPPTSLDDEASVLSDITKTEQPDEAFEHAASPRETDNAANTMPHALPQVPLSEGRRPARSSRKSVTTYNVQILAGTAIHTPTKYLEKHHKNVVHGSLGSITKKDNPESAKKKTYRLKTGPADVDDPVEEQLAEEAAQAARRRTSARMTDLRKEALRRVSGVDEAVTRNLSAGQAFLRRSASDSHLKSSRTSASMALLNRARGTGNDTDMAQSQGSEEYLKPKSKIWLKHGLYVGQHRDFDPRLSESQNRAKKRSRKLHDDDVLPLPMFAADRLLNEDPHHVFRDFKLPFDTYHPLPRKVKVDGWVKLHKNRFIGDASALWKRDKQDASQCYCDPEDGCGEACHNRIMAYECDSTNCRLTIEQCGNRPFAELKRRAKGNRYDYGVEVADTSDRGYGVRAMRTFEPHQIIVEYAGEIITQLECERRMKQVYKRDKCYYLMSFDNKMIIDATRGTIARFVNHSCEPNCEMIKWTVSGEPRMALFAGSRGIMTGEELTYDYNFDPFSQKNIQQCRCGTESCRGVLGPKPKKPVEDKPVTSILVTGTKRKLREHIASSSGRLVGSPSKPKRRKLYEDKATTMQGQDTDVALEAARDRVSREADEHFRQVVSRQHRALKRSTSELPLGRARSYVLRKQPSLIKSTRMTTVSFGRKLTQLDSAKVISRSVRTRMIPQHRNHVGRGRSRPQGRTRPRTPTQPSHRSLSDFEEDIPLNITPASLRSASKLPTRTSPTVEAVLKNGRPRKARSEREHLSQDYDIDNAGYEQNNRFTATEAVYISGDGVENSYHSAQSRARSIKGRFSSKSAR